MTLTVTVIDDHTLFREGLQGLLERHGLKVLDSVGDAESGYAAIAKRRPDIVLLDLRLPQTDGLEILRRLRESEECPPVVMLTTSDEEQDLVEALRSGASGYLLKDMEPDALVVALRSIEAGETVVAPSLTPALARVVQGREPEPPKSDESPFDVLTPRERRDSGPAGRRPEQPWNRRQPGYFRGHGQGPCQGDFAKTKRDFPGRGGGACGRAWLGKPDIGDGPGKRRAGVNL